MVFHQNIDTLVQFLFSIMSVFITIKVLNIQVQGGLKRIILRKTVQEAFLKEQYFFFYKIGQKRNVWQSVSSVIFLTCEIYCGVSKSASYIKLSDYSVSYHRGLRQTIGRWGDLHSLESYICFNICLCKCIIWHYH